MFSSKCVYRKMTFSVWYIFMSVTVLCRPVSGNNETFCSFFSSEGPIFQVCNYNATNYNVSTDKSLSGSMFLTRQYFSSDVFNYCSCDIIINPAPEVVKLKYRTEKGCSILLPQPNNTGECTIDTFTLNETYEYTDFMFMRTSGIKNAHVCFGIEIVTEDSFTEDRGIRILCDPAQHLASTVDDSTDTFNITTKLVAAVFHDDSSSAIRLKYSTAINSNSKQTHSSSDTTEMTETHTITTGKSERTKAVIVQRKIDKKKTSTNWKIIGIVFGGVFLIASGSLAAVCFRFRRKKQACQETTRYNVCANTNVNQDEYTVTDNVVYNLELIQAEREGVPSEEDNETTDALGNNENACVHSSDDKSNNNSLIEVDEDLYSNTQTNAIANI